MISRFYGNNIGRFLKPDNIITSITNPQGWNRYNYVYGNPVNLIDPIGHVPSSRSQRYKFQGGRFAYGAVGWSREATGTIWGAFRGDELVYTIVVEGTDQSAPNTGQMVAAGNVWSDTGSSMQLSATYPHSTTIDVVGEPYNPSIRLPEMSETGFMERALSFFNEAFSDLRRRNDLRNRMSRELARVYRSLWQHYPNLNIIYRLSHGSECVGSADTIIEILESLELVYWTPELRVWGPIGTNVGPHTSVVLQPTVENSPLGPVLVDAYLVPHMGPLALHYIQWPLLYPGKM